jgi:hypothetical protein
MGALAERKWVLALLLFLLVLAVRLPGVEQPFDNDSSASAYHARLINEGEPLYGTHHPGHHMPGAYYAFALCFRWLGDSPETIKGVLIVWTFAAVWLIYLLGSLLFDRSTAIAAAIFTALMTSHVRLLGLTGEIELWANLPRIAGVLIAVRLILGRGPGWHWGLVGLLGAWSLAFKAVYVSPLAVGGIGALIEYLRRREQPGALALMLRRWAWIVGGLALGVAPILAYFAAHGVLDRFLMTFTMGQKYVEFRTEGQSFLDMFTIPIVGLRKTNAVVLLLGLGAFFAMLTGRLRALHAARPTYPLAIWLFVAVLEAGITRTGFSHYYLLVVPPLALCAAPVALAGYRKLRAWLAPRRALVRVPVLVLAVAAALLTGYDHNLDLYKYWLRYKAGIVDFDTYLTEGWFLGDDLVRIQKVSDYVKERTGPEDRLYYWSGDVQLYYLTGRRCAADFIWPIDAEPTGAQPKILAPTTKYILIGQNKYIDVPPWLSEALARDFTLEAVIDEQEIYRRNDPVEVVADEPAVLLDEAKSGN